MIPFANPRTTSAPTKYSFSPTTRITIAGPTPTRYVQKVRDAHVLVLTRILDGDIIVPDPTGLPETFDQAEFGVLAKDGKVEVEPFFFDEVRKRLIANNPGVDCARDLPAEELGVLDFYQRLVMRVEMMREETGADLRDETLRPLIASAYFELLQADLNFKRGSEETKNAKGKRGRSSVPHPISPTTWRKHRRLLISFNNDLLALRDGRTASAPLRAPRIDDPIVVEVMAKWVRGYLDIKRPTARFLHKAMTTELQEINQQRATEVDGETATLTIPSITTFRRRIALLDPYEVTLARKGAAAARRKFKIAGRNDVGIAPGDRIQMDNWRTNVQALKLPHHFWAGMPEEWQDRLARLRFNLCLAIDEASKIMLGVRLSLNPAAETSIKTLEMACRDKEATALAAGCVSTWHHCLTPICVPFDGGSEFAREFRTTLRDLGATTEVGPGGKPDVRAIVERAFGTIDVQLMQQFAGRTGKNVADRSEIDPETMANVTIEVLTRCLVRWIVDVYHNSPHLGLGGETPNDAWERLSSQYGVLPPPGRERMRAVFGFRDQRAIGSRGVRFMGLHYRSRDLAVLRKAVGQSPVNIRADLEDLGNISVQNAKGDWIVVPSEIDGFDGVTAEQWIATSQALRRKHASSAKLREPIVLKALKAIREEANGAATKAGVGPTTLSADMIRAHERDLFMSFDIQHASHRGLALEGLDDEGHDGSGQPPVVSPDAKAVDPSPTRAASSRRRGGGFLSED